MMGDPNEVRFQLWFIPEAGIEQPPTLIDTVVGYKAAEQAAQDFMRVDFKEPDDYGPMYAAARSELKRWFVNPDKWVVAMPVHYGTLVIA